MTVRELKEIVNSVKDEYLDNEVHFRACYENNWIRYDYIRFETRRNYNCQIEFDINLFGTEEDMKAWDNDNINPNWNL